MSFAFSIKVIHSDCWYAFDSRRTAIILVGGDKSGDDRWYDVHIPIADKLYDEHLQEIENEPKTKEVQ